MIQRSVPVRAVKTRRQFGSKIASFHVSVLIEVQPAHKIKNLRSRMKMCKCSILTAIASGYAGRDPQGGLAIKAFKVCIEIFMKKNENSSLF